MSTSICEVMVGLPGTGKSTLVNRMYDIENTFLYSTDDEIGRRAAFNGMSYDEGFSEFIEPATKYMNEMLDIAIRSKQDIVWDQTNLGVGKRKKIINRMKQAGYQIRGNCIIPPENEVDVAEWKTRLASRPGKTIPENVLNSMLMTYTLPFIEEGFDMITFYDMHGKLCSIHYLGENYDSN
jgi:predicted ABC-type ATPase